MKGKIMIFNVYNIQPRNGGIAAGETEFSSFESAYLALQDRPDRADLRIERKARSTRSILWDGEDNYGLEATVYASGVSGRILFIVKTNDHRRRVEEYETLEEAIRRAEQLCHYEEE